MHRARYGQSLSRRFLMSKQTYKADALLLLAAFIWGTTFVAQRTGMDHVEPFIFNGARFLLGPMILLSIA